LNQKINPFPMSQKAMNNTNGKPCCPGSVSGSRLPRGFSYVEVILAAVIMSILLVSTMRLFGNLARSTHAGTEQDAAVHLALEMIQEIKNQNYQDPVISDNFGPEADEDTSTRMDFDDIDDYHNWESTPPMNRLGQYDNYYDHLTRKVKVKFVKSDDFAQVVAKDQGFK